MTVFDRKVKYSAEVWHILNTEQEEKFECCST